jgi:hypothetical protein
VAAQVPEPPEGAGHAEGELGFCLEEPLQGRPQVVVLPLQYSQPLDLGPPAECGITLFGEHEEESPVGEAHVAGCSGRLQALLAVLAQAFQESETLPASRVRLRYDQ